MYKIIELDIDGELTGDTRIEEIALTSLPAIEQGFIYFAKEQSFIVPQSVAANACKVKKYKEENGSSCGTQVGWTRASQLCDRKPISLETVKRMYSYFSRHKVDLETSKDYETLCGKQMWDAWGGDEGYKWAKSILDRYEDLSTEVEEFIEKRADETKDDYLARCIAYHIKEKGWKEDQATAVCYKQMEEAFTIGLKVSFDYDKVLTTARGVGLLLHELNTKSDVYIVSARHNKKAIENWAEKYGIHSSKIFATGSNKQKVRKIKQLNIQKHYDDNEDVIEELGRVGVQFNCPCLDEFIDDKFTEDFNLVNFEDSEPVFDTPEEAILYGENVKGCKSYHVHTDEDGNEVYMACNIEEMSEQKFSINIDDYAEDEIEAAKLLYWLKENDYQKFESVIQSLRGRSKEEIIKLNHKKPTAYFQYARKVDGFPDRDFCTDLEGRYFRRLEIDLLKDSNTEFGHNREPYSKWLYKGGPLCVHAFRKYLVQGKDFADMGYVEGKPGTAPREGGVHFPYYGYYNEESFLKSPFGRKMSQNLSKQMFKSDDEKRMIYSPLMIPNILIPRLDDNKEKYYVKFTPKSIEKMQQLYMLEKRLDKTNYEHSNKKLPSVVMVESWIVSGEKDKAFELGFDRDNIPNGTWMGGFKVLESPEGNDLWNNFIKTGKLKGFSVEGEFIMNFSRQENDEYLLSEIINIINKIN